MVSCLSCLWANECALLRCLHGVQAICIGSQYFYGARDECSCNGAILAECNCFAASDMLA